MLAAITFPAIDPVAIQIGPLAIRWYALAYIAGLLAGWQIVLRYLGFPGSPMRRVDVDDFLVWAILGVIVGGRLGYVLVYNLGYFAQHPLEMLYLWRGGMSFHGGLAGVIVALLVFCRRRNLALLATADLIASVAPLGLFFGRLANFINGELWGRVTNAPWGVVFPGAGSLPRHPSQLYEAALEGIVLFVVVQALYRNPAMRERPGLVTGAFLAGYAAARMFVEQFRQPDVQVGFLAGGATMGQWLSVPVLMGGLYLLYRARRAD